MLIGHVNELDQEDGPRAMLGLVLAKSPLPELNMAAWLFDRARARQYEPEKGISILSMSREMSHEFVISIEL